MFMTELEREQELTKRKTNQFTLDCQMEVDSMQTVLGYRHAKQAGNTKLLGEFTPNFEIKYKGVPTEELVGFIKGIEWALERFKYVNTNITTFPGDENGR